MHRWVDDRMAERQAHLKRWITGLAGLLVLAVCVAWGGGVLGVLVAAACLLSQYEYFRITCPPATRFLTDPVLVAGYGFGVALIAAAHTARPELPVVVMAFNVLACGLIGVFRFPSDRSVVELAAKQIQGLCYIGLPLSLLILLRVSPQGTTWVFLLCAVIFAGDTAALYAGTAWGRHKLSPAISPGKTVEGAAAGLAANLVVAAAGKALFLPEMSWGACVLFALSVGVMGQVGDLFESQLKRVSNVKDSGGILPGHGGVLDRIDALLFAAPVAYLFRVVVAGA
jgi:phosphatidate cytidylyltransferase